MMINAYLLEGISMIRISMTIHFQRVYMAYILPKTPSRIKSMTTNDIETVGIGLVATSNSINNVFHSNNVTDVKIQTTLQDSTSNRNNNFENNKIIQY